MNDTNHKPNDEEGNSLERALRRAVGLDAPETLMDDETSRPHQETSLARAMRRALSKNTPVNDDWSL